MTLSWQGYEAAVLAHMRQEYAGTTIRVFGTDAGKKHFADGRYSEVPRQLDVAAYDRDEKLPFHIIDTKMHSTKLDVKDIECFLGMADGVGARIAGIIAPRGFSSAAEKRARAASMYVEILSIEQALTWRWLPLTRIVYPHDWVFRREIAITLRLLSENAHPRLLISSLELLAYEEWDAVVRYALGNYLAIAQRFLLIIAESHHDDSWRYNAIQHLLNEDLLDEPTRRNLASHETDPEVAELLAEEHNLEEEEEDNNSI